MSDMDPDGRPETHATPKDGATKYVIALLVASVIVAGIGVQSWLDQRHDQRQRECFALVTDQLSQVLEIRSSANRMLETAQLQRDRAVDNIVLKFIDAEELEAQDPSPKEIREFEEEFTKLLVRFEEAKVNLDSTRKEVNELRAAAQAPKVDACDA